MNQLIYYTHASACAHVCARAYVCVCACVCVRVCVCVCTVHVYNYVIHMPFESIFIHSLSIFIMIILFHYGDTIQFVNYILWDKNNNPHDYVGASVINYLNSNIAH